MYGFDEYEQIELVAATVLSDVQRREELLRLVDQQIPVIVYFESKLGGEISIGPTPRSPEFSFDVTAVELIPCDDQLYEAGRYAIIEIQTMDFHGTYKEATTNLSDALRLHRDGFAAAVKAHPEWLSEKVEGPNIANVFKRTFYQMMFKFQIGAHGSCAGCTLAIPKAVWDSWQRHLGAPELTQRPDGTWQLGLEDPALPSTGRPPAWIYVFDIDVSEQESPNNLNLWRVIATNAPNMSYFALEVAPDAALEEGSAVDRLATTIHRRLRPLLGDALAPMLPRR